jgi:GNAT superfamily N-acetyltransferase
MKLEILESTFDELSIYKKLLEDNHVYLESSVYDNGVELPSAEHRYFIAKINNQIAGTSAMSRHISKKGDIKICHRVSFTFPEFRNHGIWTALMRAKVQYCKDNNWNESNETIHHTVVKLTDMRYSKLDWNLHTAYETKTDQGKIYRAVWYTKWEFLKKFFSA